MRKIITNNSFLGKNVYFLPSCHSTNTFALQLVRQGALQHGDVIWTTHQTAGRGQQNNQWESAPGKNLTFSLVLFPDFLSFNKQFFLNIVTALAIKTALERYQYPGFFVKWPNDIFYYNNKICGILIENQLKNQIFYSSIVGIGININQQGFSNSQATSLHNVCGQSFDIWDLLLGILEEFEKWYGFLELESWSYLKNQYEASLYWLDEWHLFWANGYFKGKIKGVNDEGKLLIATGGRICDYNFKEVSFIE